MARRWRRAIAAVVALAAALAACTPAPARSVEIDPARARRPGANPSAGCATASPPGDAGTAGTATTATTTTVTVDGRPSLLTTPAAAGSDPAPLLVSLHPFTLGPRQWEAYSGLAAAAARRGYVTLSPLGSPPGPRWSVPGGLGGPYDVDDVGWINRLIDEVSDQRCIDQNRVVAAGFSAGAAMAVALGCAAPARFAAIAASGGANLTDRCPDAAPVDALVLHGTADPIAPPSGSTVVFAPPYGLAVDAVVADLASRAGCDPEPVVTAPAPTLSVESSTGCGDHRVRFVRMLGAGHTWAGAEGIAGLPIEVAEWIVGRTNTDLDATTAVLDFFDATPDP